MKDEILLFRDGGWGLLVSSDLREKLPETAGGNELYRLLPLHLQTHLCSPCPHKEDSLKAKAATWAWHWALCSGWVPALWLQVPDLRIPDKQPTGPCCLNCSPLPESRSIDQLCVNVKDTERARPQPKLEEQSPLRHGEQQPPPWDRTVAPGLCPLSTRNATGHPASARKKRCIH